jgi:hypothetical protein
MRELPEHVASALGKERFLDHELAEQLAGNSSAYVRHFLLELLSSPCINEDLALSRLTRAMHEDPDLDVRCHAARVLGKRQNSKAFLTLLEAVGHQDTPIRVREECINNVRAIALSNDYVRHEVLNVLHQVIRNEQDDVDFRGRCVAQLAPYNSPEALEPLMVILSTFNHVLWYVAADTIRQTSVVEFADEIEQNVILPNESEPSLLRQIGFLRGAVEAIRSHAERVGS